MDILKSAEQIWILENELIVIIDISNDKAEFYDPHLVFFDSDLKLFSACYFPSQHIDSVKQHKIYARKNDVRIKRRGHYVNELPHKYQLELTDDEFGMMSIMMDKAVTRIELSAKGDSVRLFVARTEDGSSLSSLSDTSNVKIMADFKVLDTLSLPLNNLLISSSKRTLTAVGTDMFGYLFYDDMVVVDKQELDRFYRNLLAVIVARSKMKS